MYSSGRISFCEPGVAFDKLKFSLSQNLGIKTGTETENMCNFPSEPQDELRIKTLLGSKIDDHNVSLNMRQLM